MRATFHDRGRLPRFALESYFSRWEFTVRHLLCASDVQALRLDELLALASPEARARWESQELGYTHPRGSPGLRRAIARSHQTVHDDEVVCFAGAGEAIFVAMHALLDPGDHAITIVPCYQSLESVPRSRCDVTAVPLDANLGWALDLHAIERAIRPNTRLLAINVPHNPTGSIPSRDAIDALIALAREHGLYILCDEVFRGIERIPERRLPAMADLYERGLSIGVLSKSFGLPGLRLGWIACRDRGVLDRLEELRHYMSLCNARPSELLAEIALDAAPTILSLRRDLVLRNLGKWDAFLMEHGELFSWWPPDGGCIGFVRYHGLDGVETFVEDAVARAGVLLAPASVFRSALGPTPADHFRVGFGRADFEEGLEALAVHLQRRPHRVSAASPNIAPV